MLKTEIKFKLSTLSKMASTTQHSKDIEDIKEYKELTASQHVLKRPDMYLEITSTTTTTTMIQDLGDVKDTKKFKELTTLQHMLERSDMYLESRNTESYEAVVSYDDNNSSRLKKMNIVHVHALEQLFMEALNNVVDAVRRSRQDGMATKHVEATFTPTSIRFKNYGKAIPIDINNSNQWIPSIVFGELMSGNSFNDDKNNYYVGKNGYGVKLNNVYSKKFQVICYDRDRKRRFTQIWYDNVSRCQMYTDQHNNETPHLVEDNIDEPDSYVDVYYEPDFARFNVTCFDDAAFSLYQAHLMTMSFTCNIPVYLTVVKAINNQDDIANNKITIQELINITSFEDYVKCFNSPKNVITFAGNKTGEGNWECILQDTPNSGTIVAFVNGTTLLGRGGIIMDELLQTIAKNIGLTTADVERHMTLFINCNINKPNYDSRSKTYLTNTKPKIEIADTHLDSIKMWYSSLETSSA